MAKAMIASVDRINDNKISLNYRDFLINVSEYFTYGLTDTERPFPLQYANSTENNSAESQSVFI